jgi:SAM-dependent methyltransferase
MANIPGTEGARRLAPRPWDYSCYLLRQLKKALLSLLESDLVHSCKSEETTVLDFGCGTRPYESLFLKKGMLYFGADISGNPLADLSFEANEPIPMENNSVNIVLSSQVLEHVRDVQGYLDECRRVLKPDGVLILSTHGYWTYHGYPDDFYRWTFQGLYLVVEQAGFKVEKMIPCVGPLAYTTHLRNQLVRGLLYKLVPISLPIIGLINILSSVLMPLEDAITPKTVLEQNAAIYVLGARKVSETV